MNRQIKVIFTVITCLSLIVRPIAGASKTERSIQIQNESGSKVEIYWINPDTKEGLLQSHPHVYQGATLSLNSFVTHAFEAREVPNKAGKCAGENKTCRIGYFAVNENDDQVFYIPENFQVKHEDNKSIARESAAKLLDRCKEEALALPKNDTEASIEYLTSCVESSVSKQMENANEEIAFQSQIRTSLAERWENYTCADYDMPTTDSLETKYWRQGPKRHTVEVLLDRPASKVHLVKNFITPDECKAMEDEAATKLHRATVADGKGGSELSPSRKAMQAGIKIPWAKEKEGNLLTTLSRRVYQYVDHVLDLNIDEKGQEDLMSIQYAGRGEDDETPDRYTPHCDGDCTGMGHKTGGRMATMVIYCTIPEIGGATNFRNAGIHVVPEAGSATFFSYMDPETNKTDNKLTEHSGCPVVKGEKKIVTQWVRYGVDDENPWDSFNTLGIKYSEIDEDDSDYAEDDAKYDDDDDVDSEENYDDDDGVDA
mmetsp:Transcript_15312/g.18632  ORF Transcript_15312/g.18632 Transcript_15312/m.18632 type:complete len:485 (+) Transcript_15312:173-1627(+)